MIVTMGNGFLVAFFVALLVSVAVWMVVR